MGRVSACGNGRKRGIDTDIHSEYRCWKQGAVWGLNLGAEQRQREPRVMVDPLLAITESGATPVGEDLIRLVLVRALRPDPFVLLELDLEIGLANSHQLL